MISERERHVTLSFLKFDMLHGDPQLHPGPQSQMNTLNPFNTGKGCTPAREQKIQETLISCSTEIQGMEEVGLI